MSAITENMENISQIDIDKIIEILEKARESDLAKKLKSVDVIPALYVVNYLDAVDKIRKESQVPNEAFADEKNFDGGLIMRNDFKKFQLALNDTHTGLELYYSLDESVSKKQFGGMCALLKNALHRKILICDFADSKFPDAKIGRCENEYHEEATDGEPIIPLPDDLVQSLKKIREHWDLIFDGTIEPTDDEDEDRDCLHVETKEPYVDYFNPDNQVLSLCFDADYDSKKLINKDPIYSCDRCIGANEGDEGCDVTCDRDF